MCFIRKSRQTVNIQKYYGLLSRHFFTLSFILLYLFYIFIFAVPAWEFSVLVYSSTCNEGTLPVRSQSVPSWQVVPRGRDSNYDTNIYGHKSSAHIVFALLMHNQNRSGGYENREIPITWWSSCTLYGINRHNKLTTVCKCSDNLFQTNV